MNCISVVVLLFVMQCWFWLQSSECYGRPVEMEVGKDEDSFKGQSVAADKEPAAQTSQPAEFNRETSEQQDTSDVG